MTSVEFWQQLPPFEYLVTYSFNRGPKLQQLQHAADQEKRALRLQLLSSTGPQLQQFRAALRRCEAFSSELLNSPLTTDGSAFNLTATPITTLDAAAAREIGALLSRAVLRHFDWMCSPVYRDALAFHAADGRLRSVLNICFQCDRMRTGTGHEVQADAAVYQELKTLLQRLGHPIADGLEV
ncbi:hypothetical protein LJ737_24185 [Hymenobacter sp. 15J16-1T3B]|uniref:hypothetical protein n=1 Tax=Hymenobacter sp. 15J16-1T3B TaxID=2886941 RepID=UPI001D1053EB|nr:hypothetical protein [Hymenobacter sp. 15J16-1T3B]MCC3160357.1 hypothetical protein [Hymenobacter sp. 15J16-1T3B]